MPTNSDRVLSFAKHMLIHGDPVQAARDAGYEGTDAVLRKRSYGLLKHPDVADILAAVSRKDVLTEVAKTAAVTEVAHELESRAGRVRWLIRMIEGEIPEPTRVTTADGVEFADIKPSAAVRLAALKILGQMHGDFVERLQLASDTSHTIFVVPTNNRGPLPANSVTVGEMPDNVTDAIQVHVPEAHGKSAPIPDPEFSKPVSEAYHDSDHT